MAEATADGSCAAYKSTVGFYAALFLGLSSTADKAASYLRGRDPLTGALKVFYSWAGTELIGAAEYDAAAKTVRARFRGWYGQAPNAAMNKPGHPAEIEVTVTVAGRGWYEWAAYELDGALIDASDAPVELFQCAVTWPTA